MLTASAGDARCVAPGPAVAGDVRMAARNRSESAPPRAEAEPGEAGPKPALKALADRLPLWRRPGYLIRRLHQIHYALFFEECAEFGITPVQYGLLTILSTSPDADQVTLANALGIDRTNVADVLRRLEQGGLIRRKRSVDDRRMVLARLTPAGEDMVERMHPFMARAQQRLLVGARRRGARRVSCHADAAARSQQPLWPGAAPRRARRVGLRIGPGRRCSPTGEMRGSNAQPFAARRWGGGSVLPRGSQQNWGNAGIRRYSV